MLNPFSCIAFGRGRGGKFSSNWHLFLSQIASSTTLVPDRKCGVRGLGQILSKAPPTRVMLNLSDRRVWGRGQRLLEWSLAVSSRSEPRLQEFSVLAAVFSLVSGSTCFPVDYQDSKPLDNHGLLLLPIKVKVRLTLSLKHQALPYRKHLCFHFMIIIK